MREGSRSFYFDGLFLRVDLFNVVLPEKFLGYGHCPRPEIEIDVHFFEVEF